MAGGLQAGDLFVDEREAGDEDQEDTYNVLIYNPNAPEGERTISIPASALPAGIAPGSWVRGGKVMSDSALGGMGKEMDERRQRAWSKDKGGDIIL